MKRITLVFTLAFFAVMFILSAQEKGNATYYHKKLIGRRTFDGGRYNPDSLTCAHRTFPMGTYLKVRNPKNNKEVIVKVTDRGPFQRRLIIDLSYRAAVEIGIYPLGIAPVEVTKLDSLPQKVLKDSVLLLKKDTAISSKK